MPSMAAVEAVRAAAGSCPGASCAAAVTLTPLSVNGSMCGLWSCGQLGGWAAAWRCGPDLRYVWGPGHVLYANQLAGLL